MIQKLILKKEAVAQMHLGVDKSPYECAKEWILIFL